MHRESRPEVSQVVVGRRLIEDWLPIEAIGIESLRERTPMTPFPAPNRLHVWWARRPLVASRAAILGALLPANADRARFLHVLGIHGDPVASRTRIDEARRKGERFEGEAYTYKRAFTYQPTSSELEWVKSSALADRTPSVLDVTAGGGSIPFEAVRLGCDVIANDLNPVAWLILKATVEFPRQLGRPLLDRYGELSRQFLKKRDERIAHLFPAEPTEDSQSTNYMWARSIQCPYCSGLVPLSPNWKLNTSGIGVRLVPEIADAKRRRMSFEIVENAKEHSDGTVTGGDALCPFPDCGRVIDGDEIKRQAQAGQMGEQLYTVVYKQRVVVGRTKTGKEKVKSVRGYRAPRPEDEVTDRMRAALDEKMPEWTARGIVPDEEINPGNKTEEPRRYGMTRWRDLFSARQLYGHCVSVEAYQQLVQERGGAAALQGVDRAAFVYLALALDKLLNYNSRMSIWMPTREVVANTFNRHDFAFCWSHCELAPTITGLGYDWALEQTGKALEELIDLVGGPRGAAGGRLAFDSEGHTPARIDIVHGSGGRLVGSATASVDTIVLDPPYEANVMYAELSDYFYVWLKRTAGLLFPEPFSAYLTDKDREAVANVAKFRDYSKVRGSGGAKKRSVRDYQEHMQGIFAECRRVLKPEGILVLMFTHKATGAWDALAKGLVDAGFVITASWPVNTEAEGSLHIKDKNAAKSTIFLVCRPRDAVLTGAEPEYWENVEPQVVETVRTKVAGFQASGIRGVDLYLACFGPALEVFSRHWPLQRGRPVQRPKPARGVQTELFEEEWDPYAVRPEDALLAARRAVKDWRLEQITALRRRANLDPVTEFFVLAWDAYESPQFPADEALKLARVVGVSFDDDLRKKILELKGQDVLMWDSATRAQKGVIGAPDGTCLLDALHHAARVGREQNTGAAKELLERAGRVEDPAFQLALGTVLEVLPPPRSVAGTKVGLLAGAGSDAQALERLRRLAFAKDVPAPRAHQAELFED